MVERLPRIKGGAGSNPAADSAPRFYSFVVPGYGQPKQRARTTFRGGAARTYTPDKTVNFEAKVAAFAYQAGVKQIAGPVFLEVIVVRPWPKSISKKARAVGAMPTTRPDGKNVYAAVEDALNGIAYADDAQIVNGWFWKLYGNEAFIKIVVGKEIGGVSVVSGM